MTRLDVGRLCSQVDAARLQKHLEWFAKVPRDTAGPGEDRAAEYIAGQLTHAGVPVKLYEFDAFLSYPIDATIRVEGTEGFQPRALTHSFGRSVPEGLTANLVHVVDGNFGAAAGQVALVDGLATPVTVLQASQAGCAAVVFANQDWMIHNMIATTIWGTPGFDQVGRMPRLAVASVNKESGERLKALLAAGSVRLQISTELRTGWFRSKLPEVRIDGTEEPDLFCLVGGHYCAWREGITDNATGDACLMEMARLLWEHRAGLKRGVRICWWPGHSHGRYSGSTWYADTFFDELGEGCLAYHNIDSPGVRGATSYIARHTSAEVERFCRAMIERVTGQSDVPVHRPSRAADQSFLANGVPSFSTYPFLPDGHPDKRPWTGGSANAWWWHTEHDTLDKADTGILALDTRLSLTAVTTLANADLLPLNYADTAREIQEFLCGLQPRVKGHLDLLALVEQAGTLVAATDRLETMRQRVREDVPTTRALNRLAIRLGRILNPVIYSQVGRFGHDPAEWSPIMRSTKQYTLAALQKATALPHIDGQSEYGFLRAQVLREANRVRTALHDAVRLIDEFLDYATRR